VIEAVLGVVILGCSAGAGPKGDSGLAGPAGPPGKDGTSCTVHDNGDGSSTITCPDGSSTTVVSGAGVRVTDTHGRDRLVSDALAGGKVLATAAITSATAAVDGTVAVDFTVTSAGSPVRGLPAASFSANVAKLVPPAAGETFTRWVPYLWRTETVSGASFPQPEGTRAEQGDRESNGALTDHGDGSYTYVFATRIANVRTPVTNTPIAYERNRRHRISIMMGGSTGATATATYDFVPDGSLDPTSRDILSTGACRSCHGPFFAAHGGDRTLVEGCVTCHAPGSSDAQSGNTLDFKVMIHKIHAGGELASIPGPDGVVWDDPATALDESADDGFYGIWGDQGMLKQWWDLRFPAVLGNCTRCHDGAGREVDAWKSTPSRSACGSCHDTTDFATGLNHGSVTMQGGAVSDDHQCLICHESTGTGPAPSVEAAHDFTRRDPRDVPEFTAALTVSNLPARGWFAAGEAPVLRLVLSDAVTGLTIDHTTMIADDAVNAIPPGDGPEGCIANAGGTDCTAPRDGKFTSAKLYVHGPRGARNPVLTTLARVAAKGTNPGPYNLADPAFRSALALKIDGGEDLSGVDSSGGDVVLAGNVSVPVYVAGASGVPRAFSDTTHFVDAGQLALGSGRTWRDHQYAGYTVTFTDNTVTGKPTQVLHVVDNVGAAVTLDAPLTLVSLPTTHLITYAMTGGLAGSFVSGATGGTATTLVDATQAASAAPWKVDQWKGFTVKILGGTGAGQSAKVTGNSPSTLTLDAGTPLATPPDASSIYIVQPIANLAAATAAEVINWLDANDAFRARAIAYLDGSAIASATAAALAAGATTFSVRAGDGVMFPYTGSVTLDRFLGDGSGPEETVSYTRVGDVFTLGAPTVKAHASKTTVYASIAGAPAVRSRNLGKLFAIQVLSTSVVAHTALFPAEALWAFPVHLIGSNTPGATDTRGTAATAGNDIAKQTDATRNDPKVAWQTGYLTYTLDPVDDLAPGTYVAAIEVADRGAIDASNYKTPTVARVTFQVKTATEEKAPANGCGSCHTDPTDTKGLVLGLPLHRKLLDDTAVDLCGNCHDDQPQNATGDWSGPVPISRLVHAIHAGANLSHPNATVGYADGEPGRNWDIVFPQDVRNCEACHTSTAPLGTTSTSGSFKTKAGRIPCGGCHDSDSAKAHFRAATWDPTPNDPYSGDEAESCQTCH